MGEIKTPLGKVSLGASLVAIAGVLFTSTVTASVPVATSPTEEEQYFVELMNRARANPNAEVSRLSGLTWGNNGIPATPSLNEGIPGNLISSAPQEPLAFNLSLVRAARSHTQFQLRADRLGHSEGTINIGNCWTGNTSIDRAAAAGYDGDVVESIGVWVSGSPFASRIAELTDRHNGLFVDADVTNRIHRQNILSPLFNDIGVGFDVSTNWQGPFNTPFPHVNLVSYSLGVAGVPQITGVIFDDRDSNAFYTPNASEALGGYTVEALDAGGNVVGSTTTFASGGYNLRTGNSTGVMTIRVRRPSDGNEATYAGAVTFEGSKNVYFAAVSPTFSPSGAPAVWRPQGWVYMRWPYAYDPSDSRWRFFSSASSSTSWHNELASGTWDELDTFAGEWVYYSPNLRYFFAADSQRWHFYSANNEQWVSDLSTGTWSVFMANKN